jgi:hypothetical protein
LKKANIPSLGRDLNIFGAVKGFVSNLNYFSYALGYSEIQELMNQGPSSKIDSSLNLTDVPPYLADNWWIQGN